MSKIKICGLTTFSEIEYANDLKPDFIGFVFAKSKRQVDVQQAEALKLCLSSEIKAVGVFVNEDIQVIKKLCDKNIIDMVQIHGDEDEDYLSALQKEIKQPVIRAVRVQSKTDVENSASLSAAYILFDTYHKNSYGGTGECFDWSLLTNLAKPFFLAGGLSSANIRSAVCAVHPFCVDVSSGVETDGKKDKQKMKEIIQIVRSVD